MKRSSTKEVIICIIAIAALILTLTTNVFATTPSLGELLNNASANNEYNAIGDNNTPNNNTLNNNTPNNNTLNNNTPSNNALNNNTPNNNTLNSNTPNNNTLNNNAKGNNTVIPDAGLDQSVLFIIAIFGISAVYAYKKIRDYNNV